MAECHPVAGLKDELHCLKGCVEEEKKKEEEKQADEKSLFITFFFSCSGAAQEHRLMPRDPYQPRLAAVLPAAAIIPVPQ